MVRLVGTGTMMTSRTDRPDVKTRLLDVREAAAVLGVKPSTMYKWAYERRIATVKIGRALRFRESDIEALIRRSTRPAIKDSKTVVDGKAN